MRKERPAIVRTDLIRSGSYRRTVASSMLGFNDGTIAIGSATVTTGG